MVQFWKVDFMGDTGSSRLHQCLLLWKRVKDIYTFLCNRHPSNIVVTEVKLAGGTISFLKRINSKLMTKRIQTSNK